MNEFIQYADLAGRITVDQCGISFSKDALEIAKNFDALDQWGKKAVEGLITTELERLNSCSKKTLVSQNGSSEVAPELMPNVSMAESNQPSLTKTSLNARSLMSLQTLGVPELLQDFEDQFDALKADVAAYKKQLQSTAEAEALYEKSFGIASSEGPLASTTTDDTEAKRRGVG